MSTCLGGQAFMSSSEEEPYPGTCLSSLIQPNNWTEQGLLFYSPLSVLCNESENFWCHHDLWDHHT